MKAVLLVLMFGVLFIGANLYAADGDLIVNGNVGIGTSPWQKLVISKPVQDYNDAVYFQGNGWLGINPNNCAGCFNGLVQAGDKTIIFSNGSTGTGNLFIGPWSSGGGIRITGAGNVGIGMTTPNYQLQLSMNSAAKPSSTTWTIPSDERLKTNIQPYTKGLKEILQINSVSYKYNGKGGIGHYKACIKDTPTADKCVEKDIVDTDLLSKINVGVIAQDIRNVVPETVTSHKGKINEEDTDETDILDFDAHSLTFILINAVKELSTRIDSLNEQIADLKSKAK